MNIDIVAELELAFRAPLCVDNLFGHLAATAVPGVEEVRDGAYRRTLNLTHGPGIVSLRPRPDHVAGRVLAADQRDRDEAVARCRWLLDLDADPAAIDALLATDPVLAPIVAAAPGRRIPRTVDGAEMAARAVLGQQVSTAAARTTAGRLVEQHGEPIDDPEGGLTRLFPTPAVLAGVELRGPASRRRSFAALTAALRDGSLTIAPGRTSERELLALPGIGPWTAGVIAMRALGDGDAFPATDLGVRQAAAALGLDARPRPLLDHAERWRPYRAYAVQYLWSIGDHPINHWPPRR